MNYESDYVMRMLHFLRLLAQHLAGLSDAQQLSAGDDGLEEALRKLTGLSFATVDSLPPAQLAELFSRQGDGDARLYAAAEILRLRAELHGRLGFAGDAQAMERKAFRLFLRIQDVPEELAESLYVTLKAQYRRAGDGLADAELRLLAGLYEKGGYYADAEDMYCLQGEYGVTLDFYARMQAMSDAALERGGLPRAEVEEGVARIRRILAGPK